MDSIYPNPDRDQAPVLITKSKRSFGCWWVLLVLGLIITAGLGWYFRHNNLSPFEPPVANNSSVETLPPIDANQDPIQTDEIDINQITINASGGKVVITPLAKYQVSAVVLSVRNYYDDWQAEIVPTDLALGWGSVADPNLNHDISFNQSGRWYYYYIDPKAELSQEYVINHSSNHHIIPASEAIKKAVKNLKEGKKIRMDGYLVGLIYTMADGNYTITSSLTRADSGDGSCEVMYATKLQVDDKIYQ